MFESMYAIIAIMLRCQKKSRISYQIIFIS